MRLPFEMKALGFIVLSLLMVSIFGFIFGGGCAYTDYYTIRSYSRDGIIPISLVIEVRKYGEDRIIARTQTVEEAMRVLEFINSQ